MRLVLALRRLHPRNPDRHDEAAAFPHAPGDRALIVLLDRLPAARHAFAGALELLGGALAAEDDGVARLVLLQRHTRAIVRDLDDQRVAVARDADIDAVAARLRVAHHHLHRVACGLLDEVDEKTGYLKCAGLSVHRLVVAYATLNVASRVDCLHCS